MTKYYVTSGTQSLTLIAPSAKSAAMELVDRLLARHRWMYLDSSQEEQDRRDHVAFEGLLNLANTVRISQRGLGRSDAGEFGTPELLDQWHCEMSQLGNVITNQSR